MRIAQAHTKQEGRKDHGSFLSSCKARLRSVSTKQRRAFGGREQERLLLVAKRWQGGCLDDKDTHLMPYVCKAMYVASSKPAHITIHT